VDAAAENNDAFANLQHNLRELGIDPRDVPVVVQFNKRDLPNVRSTVEIRRTEEDGRPVYTASALRDEGVLPTFFGLVKLTWDRLEKRHELERKMGIDREEFLLKVRALFGKKIAYASRVNPSSALDRPVPLAELVEAAALEEVLSSCADLCGVGLRVLDPSGRVLGDPPSYLELCEVVRERPLGLGRCEQKLHE